MKRFFINFLRNCDSATSLTEWKNGIVKHVKDVHERIVSTPVTQRVSGTSIHVVNLTSEI